LIYLFIASSAAHWKVGTANAYSTEWGKNFMALETSTQHKLPLYYPDDGSRGAALLPFLVAPVAEFQDTLIVGLQSVAKLHDQFVNELYRHINNVNKVKVDGLAARAFLFRSKLCLAIILP